MRTRLTAKVTALHLALILSLPVAALAQSVPALKGYDLVAYFT